MNNREIALLVLLFGAGALYWYSRTSSGADAVNSLVSTVGGYFVNRGIRNNNPGNIRRTSIVWQGQLSRADVEANGGTYDPDFVQFDTMQNGMRALGHVLSTYATNYGLNTVSQIVSRYAPSTENDTDSYIQQVSNALNVAPDTIIDVTGNLPQLAAAIMKRETGYTDSLDNITAAVYS